MSLHVQTSGAESAPAIVFLHGLGVSSWMWTEQVEALSKDYHCLTVDLPGNGESYRESWHSLADSAAQVAGIIRARAANGKAHVVGLSLGGYVTLKLLADHPDVVETAVVSGVTAGPLTPAWFYRGYMWVTSPLMHWDPYLKANAKMMQFPAEIVPLYQRDNKRLSRDTVRRIFSEFLNFELPAVLAQRTQRVLAVAGDREMKSIKASLPNYVALIPNATAAVVPNAHHGWNGEHPQLFTDMIRAWVEGQPLPGALGITSAP